MNTPPKIRRWSILDRRPNTNPPGDYTFGLTNPEYASQVGKIAAHFVHLEELMSTVLAVLLRSHHYTIAAHVLRAIKSPRGRIDLMRDLIQLAPENREVPPEYDRIIREFSAINSLRNTYIHGLWWTEVNTLETYLAEVNDNGLGFDNSRHVPLAELQEVGIRMTALSNSILSGPHADLLQMQGHQSHLERHAPPKP